MYTENNSIEMKTVVETFIIEETESLIYDNEKLDKWNALVSELGLEGQTQIVKKDKSPIPFLFMKQSMINIFETLCPRKFDIENFNISPIPVEILSLVSLSKNEYYFDKIQIWVDDKDPDPACVGMRYSSFCTIDNDNSWKKLFNTEIEALDYMIKMGWDKHKPHPCSPVYYLIGKWGDVKHSFEKLKEMATKRYIDSESLSLTQQKKEIERKIEDIQSSAAERFAGVYHSNSDMPF
jgi:hypothetical protein